MAGTGAAVMPLSKAQRHIIHDPMMKGSKHHNNRRDERWHPYHKGKAKWQRPVFTTLPSPEISSKETSPKAQSFLNKTQFTQPQKRLPEIGETSIQFPSPPPSDKSDQAEKAAGQLSTLSQATARARLQKILAEPIHWVPATRKTFESEMTSVSKDSQYFKPAPEQVERMGSTGKKLAEESAGRSITRPIDRAAVKPVEQSIARPVEKTAEAASDRPLTDAATSAPPSKHPEQQRKDREIGGLVRSGRITKSWPSWAVNKRPHGINNPHNYCYRRSVLQAMLQTPVFISWIAKHKAPQECPQSGTDRTAGKHGKMPCIACALRTLLQKYYGGNHNAVQAATKDFDKVFNYIWPRAALMNLNHRMKLWKLLNGQQDANDFVIGLLDALSDAPRRELPMSDDTLKAMFFTTTASSWRCGNAACKVEHTGTFPQLGLIIEIRRPESGGLMDYIRQEFRSEVINQIKCDVCKTGDQRRHKRLRIVAGPEILIVQLRRFYQASSRDDRFVAKKCFSKVAIPSLLNLDELQPTEFQGKNKLLYELKHTIFHIGQSIAGGHYVSNCEGPDGKHFFDDELPPQKNGRTRGEPYILVYTRKAAKDDA